MLTTISSFSLSLSKDTAMVENTMFQRLLDNCFFGTKTAKEWLNKLTPVKTESEVAIKELENKLNNGLTDDIDLSVEDKVMRMTIISLITIKVGSNANFNEVREIMPSLYGFLKYAPNAEWQRGAKLLKKATHDPKAVRAWFKAYKTFNQELTKREVEELMVRVLQPLAGC